MLSNTASVVRLVLSVLYFLAVVPEAFAKVELRTVAIKGQIPSEPGNGTYFFNFYEPTINLKGQVAFRASLLDPSAPLEPTKDSVWLETSGHLQAYAVRGWQVEDRTFASFNQVRITDDGNVGFNGTIDSAGAGIDFAAVFTADGTQKLFQHRGGQVLGGVMGESYYLFSTHFLTESGMILFSSTDAHPDQWQYRYLDFNGTSSVVDPYEIPGVDPLETEIFPNEPSAVNHQGDIVALFGLQGPTITDASNTGLLLIKPDPPQSRIVVREGSAATGAQPAAGNGQVVYGGLDPNARVNNAGQVAFTAKLVGPGITTANNQGIWSEGRGNGLELIARTGDPAPGMDPGIVFQSFNNVPVAINGLGQVAFGGIVSGPGIGFDNGGIWSEGMGNGLELVHRDGASAPGVNGSVNISTFSFNALGQVMFLGFFGGTTANHGIWAQDLEGNLHLIARTGQLIDVANGPAVDMRTISNIASFYTSGNEDGRASSFNDRGQIVFRASFTDGSEGIFVSNAVAVPEPTSVLLALTAILGARRRSWRKRDTF